MLSVDLSGAALTFLQRLEQCYHQCKFAEIIVSECPLLLAFLRIIMG